MTKLERLQKQIDNCRKENGNQSCWNCDCEYARTGHYNLCPLVIAHHERIEYCTEKNIPVEQW